jgi:hypothetical protein
MKVQEIEVWLYSFFNLGTRWGWVVNASPQPLYPEELHGTHCVEGWVKSQGRFGRVYERMHV